MKRASLVLVQMLILLAGGPGAFAQGTAFTYQGQLKIGTNAANANYDFEFALHSAPSGNSQVGNVFSTNNVPVSNGLFTVTLDFGAAAFSGQPRWLQISVLLSGSDALPTILAPRQPITATPYAITARNVTGTVSGNGAGLTDVNALTLGGLAPSSFWQLGGNSGTTPGTHFLGTTDDRPLLIHGSLVGIGRATQITSAEFFGVHAPVTHDYGGMYIETAGVGLPFYGYAMGGVALAWTYLDGNDGNKWKLYNAGFHLTVAQDGNVGIGTTSPSARLDVAGQVKIAGGAPGDGKLLMSDANGLASWRSPSELSVFFGQNYSVLFPDVINNTAPVQIGFIEIENAVIVNGPGLQIERIAGFTGQRPNDQPGPNMEFPFVFECDGPRTNDLENWYHQFTNNPAVNRQVATLIINRLNGTEAGRWNLFEMGLTRIEPGTDGRHRYTLQHGLAPNNFFSYENDLLARGDPSRNPATDLYRIEINGVTAGPYPSTQIDYANRTITLTYDYIEAGQIRLWVKSTAEGSSSKVAMSVITESNGVEVSRRNFFGVFPIWFQQTSGFGQVEKIKERVIISFDWWEEG